MTTMDAARAGRDDASALAEILHDILARPRLDESAVERVAERVAQRVTAEAVAQVAATRPVVVEVRRPDGRVVEVKGAHHCFPRVVRLVAAGLYPYLYGAAGTGKSTAALAVAEALGAGGEVDTLDPSTARSAVLGYRSAMQNEPVHTAFSRCWTEGRVYVADEADNAPAHVQTLYNSALANGHAPLAWGSVPRADGFGFVATGNTPGRPTIAYPDRRPMSAAFRDRLYFVPWSLDENIERRAAGLPEVATPRRVERTCTAVEWATWVLAVRAWTVLNAPTIAVTPRATLNGLAALSAGETPDEVAEGVVFRGADDALRHKALAAVPLP